MVSFHGRVQPLFSRTRANGVHDVASRPPDPKTLLKEEAFEEKVQMLADWWRGKRSIFCITGAGLSTESGIPDYRGHKGSYHAGHKPMIHQHFMENEFQRKRYWGRAMVGWKEFDSAQPNKGHVALAELERLNRLGVLLDDSPDFYDEDEDYEFMFSSGQQKIAIVSQNVDSLHHKAGSKGIVQLHGAGNVVKCMNCGHRRDRADFHNDLEAANKDWLENAIQGYGISGEIRPDGDALVKEVNYNDVEVPGCQKCKKGFYKTDVVFFGDNVPKNRVALCNACVESAHGVLVVGSSLAVHSAFRHVRAASRKGTPVAILNVGETRAEVEALSNILKIEAPAGDTLSCLVGQLQEDMHDKTKHINR